MNKNIAFYPNGTPFSGDDTMKLIRQKTDTVLLSFSGGKDSIACWLKLRDHFNVIPFFMYVVPDLEFINESIDYYERFFNTKIIRVPHPSLYRMLNNFVFQPPDRVAIIHSANLPNFTYDDLSNWIGADHKLKPIFTANGVRAADSPNRRSSINAHGPITWSRNYFYPCWDMRIKELVELLKKHNVKLSDEYKLFGRSFDGIDHRFLHIIKDVYPRDYETIIHWFPLAVLEVARYGY